MATKSEIKKIASALDSVAEAIEKRYSELGIPEKVASDFAYRCDLLADTLDKTAGGDGSNLDVEAEAEGQAVHAEADSHSGSNPVDMLVVTKGPLEHGPSDSETLDGEFTQEEFSSLFNLLKGLSEGSDILEDDDSHEEPEEDEEEHEKSDEDDDLAEQLQKVAAQLRAKAKKK